MQAKRKAAINQYIGKGLTPEEAALAADDDEEKR